ncbi:hypothetical protein LXT23_05965 [Pyxidicoccus sp. QH1ED-7-1]|nr:hypothetical protein [Pyxidicoccus xibeiensis]MCP3136878.1 hypothetical protein [Pyxidicoccus xibeiensis]
MVAGDDELQLGSPGLDELGERAHAVDAEAVLEFIDENDGACRGEPKIDELFQCPEHSG